MTELVSLDEIDEGAHAYQFVEVMLRELRENTCKGSFLEWEPTEKEFLAEIDHHLNKFKLALANKDLLKITEYAADIANYCMKAHIMFGEHYMTNEVDDFDGGY